MKSELVITVNDLPQDVLDAIDQGRKIEAIKLLREATGLGLANAKVLVDRAASQRNPTQHPPAFEEQGGASRVLKNLLLVALGIALYHYFLQG